MLSYTNLSKPKKYFLRTGSISVFKKLQHDKRKALKYIIIDLFMVFAKTYAYRLRTLIGSCQGSWPDKIPSYTWCGRLHITTYDLVQSAPSQQTRGVHPMLFNVGPTSKTAAHTLHQHWVNASCLLGYANGINIWRVLSMTQVVMHDPVPLFVICW